MYGRPDADEIITGTLIIGLLLFMAAAFVAWATPIGWIITKLAGNAGITVGQFILALLGTFVPPVGIIHGVMIWFGLGL